jgi:hypothetical protein
MAAGAFFEADAAALAPGDDFVVDPADAGTGAVEIHSILHGGDCDVSLQIDVDGDDTYEIDVTIDQYTGAGYTQQNKIELESSANMRLVITNTAGATGDYAVTGVEVTA